jgi:uncharacterized repeat protein (TIGR03803 family)
MKRQKPFLFVIAAATLAATALCATNASAGTENILYGFHPTLHGQFPAGGLISDSAGNLYGVTANGGLYDNGAVFMLSPNSHSGWTQTVLYSFKGHIGGANDGIAPNGTLTFDSAGNLFGATTSGGKSSSDTLGTINDAGIIFKLTKTNGTWKESIIWTFDQFSSTDGFNPQGGMVFDRAGNLYGTTFEGGGRTQTSCNTSVGCGTVFRLSPKAGGHWTEQILYVFQGQADGDFPNDGLAIDAKGDLYGTTRGESPSDGVVFKVSNSGGIWTETTIYTFSGGADGDAPGGNLIFDNVGDLYGVTQRGGTSTGCSGFPCGTVFELTPGSSGEWSEKVLYSFNGNDGSSPIGKLLFDQAGNLYGTTAAGGPRFSGTKGVVFELTPAGNGQWNESVLWNFTGGADGANPSFGVIAGSAGQLYGTVSENPYANLIGNGVVFQLTLSQGRWQETTIDSFPFSDGGIPQAALIADAAGALYGTTAQGGSYGYGTVFKLTNSVAGWQETTLYNFTTGSPQGPFSHSNPSSLIFDTAGNLYGETETGGSSGYGLVFELSPTTSGEWIETTLFNFTGTATGAFPLGGLVFDSSGNLYGTTEEGGLAQNGCRFGCGTAFKLTPQLESWSETILYNFAGGGTDGALPLGGAIFDQAGNLYGTTSSGGIDGAACSSGCGTVFKLTPSSGGAWTESVLYEFAGANGDGGLPVAGLIFDNAGNLYGSTFLGGNFNQICFYLGCGTVFELSPKSGAWSETILYAFRGEDAISPNAALIFDQAGNLYGTTEGGVFNDEGTVFELSPASGGTWSVTTLHTFPFAATGDGEFPHASLTLGPSGVLYGTTADGGSGFWGTVFQITP